MINSAYKSYKTSNVGTADRGKLILMVYDHCIKWCRKAQEDMSSNNIEGHTKAILKVQDGLTELMCALNFEKGGPIASNLFNLYDFFSRHLTRALREKSPEPIEDVMRMLLSLRGAWEVAVETVRKSDRNALGEKGGGELSLVG